MRILLIEDDEEICQAVQAQLEKEGYMTDICNNGMDAVYYVSRKSYDAVILDRLLPGMDGLSIVQLMRRGNIRTPVIMATAMGSVSDRIDGLDCGGARLRLSKREAVLAEFFLKNPEKTLPRELLFAHVWGPDSEVENGNLDNYIHFLRKRIRVLESRTEIITVHNSGYLLQEKHTHKHT